ncbi:hypothetical protein NESM_000872100 [Novymonas esmeraldas]|uniref:DNA-binding protein n=1 Tax=Novymonas esmeraldas TaxID=1808958 RepID=A0AAW0F0D4_9TRYP
MTTTAQESGGPVRVELQKANAASTEKVKARLHEGVSELTIAALDFAIGSAVVVAQTLRDQNMVEIKSIYTRRGPLSVDEKRSRVRNQIEIRIAKTSFFDSIYEEQARARAEERAARDATPAATGEAVAEEEAAAAESESD